jgi:beta-galactosidase
LKPDGKDLSFITVKVLDEAGNMIPDANNLVRFEVSGNGFIAGVDNGCQTSMESFKGNFRKAFNGMCLLIVQSKKANGKIVVKATSDGLSKAELSLFTKKQGDDE